MNSSLPIVEVKDLIIEFNTPHGRKRVVNQVSLSVSPGEVLGVLGESGSGKTMTTQAILGLVEGYPGVVGGEIMLRSNTQEHALLSTLSHHTYYRDDQIEVRTRAWRKAQHKQLRGLWGQAMTAIFQNPRRSLDPLMTVGQQVMESIVSRERHQSTKVDKALVRDEALSWLSRVQMVNPSRVFSSYPHELSGGMCQRAMIAVALACRPALLIADEPTTGLDATVRAQVVELLQHLIKDERCAMIYITHDIREMLYLADRIMVMRHGEVIERATPDELRDEQRVHQPYTAMLLDAAGLMGQVDTSKEEVSYAD